MQRIDIDATHFEEHWIIEPNPNIEYVYLELPPNTQIDEVVIDTWSTDEPIATAETCWGKVKSLFH